MKRVLAIAAILAVGLLALAPVALAADPGAGQGRVMVSVHGDVTLPAGESADTIVVVDGVATIAGDVKTLVIVEGSATLDGAQAETVWAVRSDVELGPGTVVTGEVMTLDSPVHQTGNASVAGGISDMSSRLFAMGAFLAPAILLFWLGAGLATIVAGLLLAALASRQVRSAELVISREPVTAFLVGLFGLIVIPIAAVLLMITIVGAPLGLGVMFMLWPLLAYVGYLVAGIFVGEWLLNRSRGAPVRERPYLAAVIGLVLLQLIGIVPVVGVLSAIASVFGFGAVLVLAWRTLTSGRTGTQPFAAPAPMPG
jgi:hypothetical protein